MPPSKPTAETKAAESDIEDALSDVSVPSPHKGPTPAPTNVPPIGPKPDGGSESSTPSKKKNIPARRTPPTPSDLPQTNTPDESPQTNRQGSTIDQRKLGNGQPVNFIHTPVRTPSSSISPSRSRSLSASSSFKSDHSAARHSLSFSAARRSPTLTPKKRSRSRSSDKTPIGSENLPSKTARASDDTDVSQSKKRLLQTTKETTPPNVDVTPEVKAQLPAVKTSDPANQDEPISASKPSEQLLKERRERTKRFLAKKTTEEANSEDSKKTKKRRITERSSSEKRDSVHSSSSSTSERSGSRSPSHTPLSSESEGEEVIYNPMTMGCRHVEDHYKRLNTIDEGTYGVVHRAQCIKTKQVVALKKVKMEQSRDKFFPITSLREMSLLLELDHPNIVKVIEIVVGRKHIKEVYMVMEYCDHDFKGLMSVKKDPFSLSEIKCLVQQLLRGVGHLHDNWIIHRDLKTSNLLLNNKGILKICDFGMARKYGDPLIPYTQVVCTLWYRAIEILLGQKRYSTPTDIWSVGCIVGEFFLNTSVFQAKTEASQVEAIFRLLGTPDKKRWPEYENLPLVRKLKFKTRKSKVLDRFPVVKNLRTARPSLTERGLDLLQSMFEFNPKKRTDHRIALAHPWFHEAPRPQDPALLPTFPTLNTRRRKVAIREMKKDQRRAKMQKGFHI